VPSVLVFGSVHIDHLLRVPRFPLPGETLSGESGGRQLGGKAVNQALAASKTVPTWLVAAIGHDRAGQQASERLEADGVAAYLEVIPELPTGESVALLEPDGENRAVILPGANHGLTAQMVIRQIERFQPSLVVTQLESHPETTDKVLDHCGKQRIPVLLNAAPYRTLAPIQIAQLEYLVVNQLEAQQLFGLEVSDHGLRDLAHAGHAGRSRSLALRGGPTHELRSSATGQCHHQPRGRRCLRWHIRGPTRARSTDSHRPRASHHRRFQTR
jgi:ribokinase